MNHKIPLLRSLFSEYLNCTACDLCNITERKVIPIGNPNADILIVGIGPGEEEEKQGIPFVGPSGKLLHSMLLKLNLISYNPDTGRYVYKNVYITNLVLCRPANLIGNKKINRDPSREEIQKCMERLSKEIYIVDPIIIIAAGELPFKILTKKVNLKGHLTEPASYIIAGKEKPLEYPVLGMWHPARLIRQPDPQLIDAVYKTLSQAKQLAEAYKIRLELAGIKTVPDITLKGESNAQLS